MAADWGVSRLLTVVRTDGPHHEAREDHDNPRWYAGAKERLVALDRAVSSKKRGSKNWRKACAQRGSFKSKLVRKRHEHQHQLSAEIAARCGFGSASHFSRSFTAHAGVSPQDYRRRVRGKLFSAA
jgi:AraC-like DNA-binding protein